MSAEEENLPDKAKAASLATDKNYISDKSSFVVDDLGKRTKNLQLRDLNAEKLKIPIYAS